MEKRYTECAGLKAVTKAVKARQGWMLERLRKLVEAESPSGDKAAVDRAAALVAEWSAELGGRVKRHRQREFGDLLEVRFGPVRAKEKPVMLLGHLDTVWELGTLKTMPWREDRQKIFGPGVYDMKSGVMMALTAIAALQDCDALKTPVVVVLVSEEETGSPVSRAVTERLARGCSAVFVMEPAQGAQGAYKTRCECAGWRLTAAWTSPAGTLPCWN
jgi:glutamate carboxypeptidase